MTDHIITPQLATTIQLYPSAIAEHEYIGQFCTLCNRAYYRSNKGLQEGNEEEIKDTGSLLS